MQFDPSGVEAGTLVFVGTMVFAAVLAAFVLAAALVALVLLGVGQLAWTVVATTLLAVVHGINAGWHRLAHHAATTTDGTGDFHAQPSP